jgi:hypothetical protein
VSHLVRINTQVRDRRAVGMACRRLGFAEPTDGTARLYAAEASGLLLHLPQWRYPVVLDLSQGEIRFDNFEGKWGDRSHLDRFLQMYAVERAKLEARKAGQAVAEELLQDGSIRLRIGQAA